MNDTPPRPPKAVNPKIPQAKPPQAPQTPCRAHTPKTSSNCFCLEHHINRATNKPPATTPVASAPTGWKTSDPAQTATKPARGPLWINPGSFLPMMSAAIVPPTMAIKEFTATKPLMPSTACALMTLKPNQPTVRIQAPSARKGMELGAKLITRPSFTRPRRDPSNITATKASQPPMACTTIEPAKSWNP